MFFFVFLSFLNVGYSNVSSFYPANYFSEVSMDSLTKNPKLSDVNSIKKINSASSNSLSIPINPTNNILYVKKGASGSGDGSSWANAVPELADALKWANENKAQFVANPLKIYIAKGTYKPMYSPEDGKFGTSDGRKNTFLMVDNVELYGGFDPDNGIKTLTDKRIIPDGKNEAPNGTILSGDLNVDDRIGIALKDLATDATRQDNTYHVIVAANSTAVATMLDGLTITGGNANGGSSMIINGWVVATSGSLPKTV